MTRYSTPSWHGAANTQERKEEERRRERDTLLTASYSRGADGKRKRRPNRSYFISSLFLL